MSSGAVGATDSFEPVAGDAGIGSDGLPRSSAGAARASRRDRRLRVGGSRCGAPAAASAGRGLPVVLCAVGARPGERAYRSEADMSRHDGVSAIPCLLFSYEREECSDVAFGL